MSKQVLTMLMEPSLQKRYKDKPLTKNLLEHHVFTPFNFSKVMYDGKGDPYDHLSHIVSHMNPFGASHQVKCRAFSMTLKDTAQARYL
ncbi:hypothetical protein V6N12_013384 [Hibiscus sabdariffa]|uniref:Uncharacterized protein n=1 Tax=Hibiscus sabdariffa TaxID=183260 RepID=A0ABR2D6C2_9ROSI